MTWDVKNSCFNENYKITLKDLSQEFRLKNIEKTRNYFVQEKEQNKLMSRKHKKIITTLIFFEHFLILVSLGY